MDKKEITDNPMFCDLCHESIEPYTHCCACLGHIWDEDYIHQCRECGHWSDRSDLVDKIHDSYDMER